MNRAYRDIPNLPFPANAVLGMGVLFEEAAKGAYDVASKNRVIKKIYGLHPERIEELKETSVESLKEKFNKYRNSAMTKMAIGSLEIMGGATAGIVTIVLAANEPQMFQSWLDSFYQLTIANIPSESIRDAASIAALYGIIFGPVVTAIDGTVRYALSDGELAEIDEEVSNRDDWQEYYGKLKNKTEADVPKNGPKQTEITSF